MRLVIGNKNFSSWSLRVWLGMKVAGIPFEEISIRLRQPDTREQALQYSPAGKVPALLDETGVVWDSLAIAEYLAEQYPELWPSERKARALARSICAEMHGGFAVLRAQCGMDIQAQRTVEKTPELERDINRIVEIWSDCRQRFGDAGPFLFGKFTWADAFYAPVVARFVSYSIEVSPLARAYMDSILALPAMQEWVAAAKKEELVNPVSV